MSSPNQTPGDPRLDTVVRLGIASGTISVAGSTMIIVILLRSPKKLKSLYRRLVFGLSCMDIVHSLTYVAGGLPVPNDAGSWHSNYAIGNVTTCNIQGFMNYTGLMGSLFYACMLSIYFTLVIVYSKNDNLIQKSVEPFFHAFSILIPLGLGIFLMATNHFNSVGFTCWIHWYPSLCKEEENIDCTRGEDASWYKIYFQYVPLAFVCFIFFACMIRLMCSIRSQYKKMTKYGSNEILANIKRKRQSIQSTSTINAKITQRSSIVKTKGPSKSQNEMKQTFIQAILYISGMILALIFPVFLVLFQTKENEILLWELQNFFLPLLGFYNFLIFIRPRVVITMQAKPNLSLLKALLVAVTSKEVKPPQGRKSVLINDAKYAAKKTQEEEEEEENEEVELEEVELNEGEEKYSNDNDDDEESKEEIVAYQCSLHGRENHTPPTYNGLNQMRNEREKERKDGYDDENEESKEEIVTYQCSLHGRENNTSPTNNDLSQMSNDSLLSPPEADVENVDLTDDYNNML